MNPRNYVLENENEVKKYCVANRLDTEKVFYAPMSLGKDRTTVYHFDPEKGKGGLMNETPMPAILKVYKTDTGIRFEQTPFTRKYAAV